MLGIFEFYYAVALLLSFLSFDGLVAARSFRQPPISSATIIKDPRILSWQFNPSTVHCTSKFTLLFRLAFPDQKESTQIRLALEPNHDLLQDATMEYIGHDGKTIRTEAIERHEHKVYKGETFVRDELSQQWREAGWTRIMVLRDGSNPLFEGVFLKDGDVHHVKLLSKYNAQKDIEDMEFDEEDPDETMIVYRDSDRFVQQGTILGRSVGDALSAEEANSSICAHDRLEFNMQDRSKGFGLDFLGRLVRRQDTGTVSTGGSRSALAATVGDTTGCQTTRRVALVAAAADCTYVSKHGNATATRAQIISIFNQASALYEDQFNISLGLSNIVMTDSACPATAPTSAPWNSACSSNFSMDDDLSTFSQWRGERGNDNVALWTLLTGCSAGAEVGVAWLGMLCQYKSQTQGSQTVTGANVVSATQDEWKVLAHEIGHGFGAYHDCTSQTCPTTQVCCPLSSTTCDANQQYIMNPTTMDATNRFSPCTIGNICSGFANKQVSQSCLTSNKNVTLITAGECGNGIVEDGEECDCGGTEGCGTDSCCDPTTCKFTTGAVCDDSNDACCKGCQYAPSTQICRASVDATCDPAEHCTGNSSACPADVTTPDGTSCGSGLQCAGGTCTSRDLQCQQAINGSTGACDDSSCMLSCSSSTLGPNTCLLVQQNFVDGTPCGIGLSGRCENGQCENQSTGAAIGDWIAKNKVIVIAVASVLGGLLLLCLACCLWRKCVQRRKTAAFAPPNRQMAYPPPRRSAPPPPPRNPSMVYYPQAPYGPAARQSMTPPSHAPPYAEPYAPPMRHSRAGSEPRVQQPGEEWIRGADGSFYPPPSRAPPAAPPPPPPPHVRRPSYNQNGQQNRYYWED